MELKDTVNMMLSDDYRQGVIAEYVQLVIRREKLECFIENAVEGCSNPKLPSNPYIYRAQRAIIDAYINVLQIRAIDEHIELPSRREIMGWT